MSIAINIPGPLRTFTDGCSEVALTAPAATVREALDLLGSLYPGVRDRILTEQGALREHINIFVGNEDVRYTGGLATPLPAAAVITIVPAISGGSDAEHRGWPNGSVRQWAMIDRRDESGLD